jgi:hypothetical protein
LVLISHEDHIVSFAKGLSFHVRVNKSNSATHPFSYGVPQGAILSPSLYNFFTADFPQCNDCETATFTDDTAIFVSDWDSGMVCAALQSHLETLSTYRTMDINAFKTWVPRTLPFTNIGIGSHPIPWSTEVKYLRGKIPSTRDLLLPVTPNNRKIGESLPYTLLIFEQDTTFNRPE